MTTVQHPAESLAWYALPAEDVAGQLGVDPDAGLDTGEAERRLAEYGPAPEDKLRLARLMQQSGNVVAMTGNAVNDAAALKQADVGVAMGSGSEVSKQAAKIVLTDDNFATLVRAVDLGRDIYRRISTYIRMQLTILSSVLQLMVYATILNINGGVALFPLQLLFCKFFVVITVVIGFIVDVPDPGVMQRPPRKPGTKIVTRPWIIRWFIFGFVVAATALAVLEWGPGKPSTTHASVNMTMAFAIVSFSAVNIGLVMRRERQAPWSSPVFPYLGWIILGWILPGPPSNSACSSGCSTPLAVRAGMDHRARPVPARPRGRRRRQGPPTHPPAQNHRRGKRKIQRRASGGACPQDVRDLWSCPRAGPRSLARGWLSAGSTRLYLEVANRRGGG